MHDLRVGRQMCIEWLSSAILEELRFGSRRNFQRPNLPVEASFWLPNPAPKSWTFGSGGEFRPPKVPPNMHEFRLWRDFRPPNLPPKVPCPAISCMFSCDYSMMFFDADRYRAHTLRRSSIGFRRCGRAAKKHAYGCEKSQEPFHFQFLRVIKITNSFILYHVYTLSVNTAA